MSSYSILSVGPAVGNKVNHQVIPSTTATAAAAAIAIPAARPSWDPWRSSKYASRIWHASSFPARTRPTSSPGFGSTATAQVHWRVWYADDGPASGLHGKWTAARTPGPTQPTASSTTTAISHARRPT